MRVGIIFSLCVFMHFNLHSQLVIRAFGDSFTAGTGATSSEYTYPSQLGLLLGSSVINKGIGGQTSTEVTKRLIADSLNRNFSTIIWEGRNNFSDSATVLKDIASCIAELKHDRYLVLEIMNGDYPVEKKGNSQYKIITDINRKLAMIYKAHFVPIRDIIINSYDQSNFWDSVCHSEDISPKSLRYDSLHFNNKGYSIVAQSLLKYKDILFGLTELNQSLQLSISKIDKINKISCILKNQEQSSSYYIERSSDSTNFYIIKRFTAQNIINNSFNWNDSMPLNGKSFYRLKKSDANGNITFSVTVESINIDSINRVSFINSFSNEIQLNFINVPSGEYTVLITNVNGQNLASLKIKHNQDTQIEKLHFTKTGSTQLLFMNIYNGNISYRVKGIQY